MRRWTSLITAGERGTLQAALLRGRVMALEWEVPSIRLRVRVSTQRAGPVWAVPMLIRLEQWGPGTYSTQLFGSVEAMLDGH